MSEKKLYRNIPFSKEYLEDWMSGRTEAELEPDWSGKCKNCGQSPIVPCTGMCGPCTFGEAETMGGNW